MCIKHTTCIHQLVKKKPLIFFLSQIIRQLLCRSSNIFLINYYTNLLLMKISFYLRSFEDSELIYTPSGIASANGRNGRDASKVSCVIVNMINFKILGYNKVTPQNSGYDGLISVYTTSIICYLVIRVLFIFSCFYFRELKIRDIWKFEIRPEVGNRKPAPTLTLT